MNITGFDKIAKYLAVPLVLVGFVLMLFFGIHDKLIDSGLLAQVSAGDSSEIIKLMLHYGFQLGLCVTVLGFGLAAWSKYMDKVQPVDAGKLAEKLVGPLQGQLEAKDEQIKALTEAITALSKTGASTASINDALRALEQGDTAKAQVIFNEVLRSKEAEGRQANKEAAAAARHLGALAYMNDTKAALAAYRKAVALDPDNAEGWNEFGHLLRRTGELGQAEKAYCKVLKLSENHKNKAEEAAAYGNLGVVHWARGALDHAEQMHKKALEINEALASKEGMAVNYTNLGIVYAMRGDLNHAEQMQEKALLINEALGRKERMEQLFGNIGNLYYARGDLDQAEHMHKKALAISKVLGNKESMAQDYSNLGVVYASRGDLDQAKQMYKKSLGIHKSLGSKGGLAAGFANLGTLYRIHSELKRAEQMYKKSLSLYQEIGHPDTKMVQQWLDDLAEQRTTSTQ